MIIVCKTADTASSVSADIPLGRATALYDFAADDSTTLAFKEGDELVVWSQEEGSEWYWAELDGKVKELYLSNFCRSPSWMNFYYYIMFLKNKTHFLHSSNSAARLDMHPPPILK